MQDINEKALNIKSKSSSAIVKSKDDAQPQAQPKPAGSNFSLGGIDPKTNRLFLGTQPGRDPADTLTGKLANRLIPRLDKATGRAYMGTQVGKDPISSDEKLSKSRKTTDDVKSGVTAKATPSATSSSDQVAKPAATSATPSSFGAAFKAAREARLKGGKDTFEYNGKQYHSYQAGERRSGAATPAARPAAPKPETGSEKLSRITSGGITGSLPSSYKPSTVMSIANAQKGKGKQGAAIWSGGSVAVREVVESYKEEMLRNLSEGLTK